MAKILLYFQVHQPYRLSEYNFFNIGKNHLYENTNLNKAILEKVALNAYLPMNALLEKYIHQYGDAIKIQFGISGVALEQFAQYKPEVLQSFQSLIATGKCDILAETYYHSLATLYDKNEAAIQIKKHSKAIQEYFNITPSVFRNTELIYSNDIADQALALGYHTVITEYVDRIMKKYTSKTFLNPTKTVQIICRNHHASDDIAFRFSDKKHPRYPVTVDGYYAQLKDYALRESLIPIFMDYETFGEHQKESSGIFNFFEKLIEKIVKNGDFELDWLKNQPFASDAQTVDIPDPISWADTSRDLSAWLSNSMQYEAIQKIYAFKDVIRAKDQSDFTEVWRKLQTSDHFYYMSTKYWADGDVHTYFSPFNSPYDAYIYYMNVLSDMEIRIKNDWKNKN